MLGGSTITMTTLGLALVSELCGACAQYVTDCFSNHSLFHKALKEAFEQFCNKPVGQSSSAELMASFCDNLLRKVGSLGVTCQIRHLLMLRMQSV